MSYHLPDVVSCVKFAREAASVQRAHTVPFNGEYNVGYHTFNMMSMLRILRPDAPVALIWAILEHDIPERLTGDIPSPAKWFKLVDRDKLTELEFEILEGVGMQPHEVDLPVYEVRWLKGLDILELYLWTKDQIHLGNKNVVTMKRRIETHIARHQSEYPIEVIDLYHECKGHPWYMMPDLGEADVGK